MRPIEDPWAPVRVRRGSARRTRRFAAALDVDGAAAEDALAWLPRPLEPGPSGTAGPLARLVEARSAAFQEAAPADAPERLRELEAVLLTERRAARAALESSRRHGAPLLLVSTAVFVMLLAVAVGLTGRSTASGRAAATAASGTTGVVPAQSLRVTDDERAQILGLFARADGASLRQRFQAAVDATADSLLPADGLRTGAAAGIVGGIVDAPGAHRLRARAGGALTLGLVLGRPVPWRATIAFDDGSSTVLEGTTLGGRLQYALVLPPPRARAASIAFDLPTGVRYSWQVLHRG